MSKKSIKCPICKGSGKLPETYDHRKLRVLDKKIMAKLLRKEGYSIREIMRFLEYKSTRSVSDLLKK